MHQDSLAPVMDGIPMDSAGRFTSQTAEMPASWEQCLEATLDRFLPAAELYPQPLHRAMRYAVFSGGKRLRPRLVLQVAAACGVKQDEMELAMRLACAVELIHAGSLVHDDLPCFDDASERRGRPTVHVQFGEPMAVLVGDALLSQAFEVLADAKEHSAKKALRLLSLLGRATGSAFGIIGGQSLEQPGAVGETGASPLLSPERIERYHQMKTGALFRLATEAAVVAGAANPAAWARVGLLFGNWYQLTDDLLDVKGQAAALGKPVGKDAALGRPNALLCHGEAAVEAQLKELFAAIWNEVLALAITPGPLLRLLSGLRDSLLKGCGGKKGRCAQSELF